MDPSDQAADPMKDAMDDSSNPGKVSSRPSRVRSGSVFVRAAHLLGVSAVAGAYLLGVEGSIPHGWWLVTGVSGLLLLAAESIQHAGLYRELAGWATILKLVLVACVFIAPGAAPWLVAAAIVIAALGAHFPRNWRHRKLF